MCLLSPWSIIKMKCSQLNYYFGKRSSGLAESYKDVYVSSFFPRTARLWNSLPGGCLRLTYDLNGFNPRVNRNLFFFGSFLYSFPLWFLSFPSFSCNSIPSSDCSTLHGVKPNLKKWLITKLNKQQNSSFGLIEIYLALWAWKRILYIFYKNEPWSQSIRKPRPYFRRPSEQKSQGWKNLQNMTNPVNTFIIQNFFSKYFWNLLIQILFGAFKCLNL